MPYVIFHAFVLVFLCIGNKLFPRRRDDVQRVPLKWNPPRWHVSAAASELPGNELVITQNIAVACL
jgi:hypothetical protein